MLLSKIIFNAFATLLKSNPDAIEETLRKYSEIIILSAEKDAVLRINFPVKLSDIETARKRLVFEELFYLELILALKKVDPK
ncbi:MAG: hypothetical protein R3A12_07445 [Ignavibacteria bacterium]